MATSTTAFDTGSCYLFRVHLDTTKTIPDPDAPPPAAGEPDTRPQVPDPAYVREWTWGKEPPEGVALEDYLQQCKREAELLAEAELAQLQPPQEISV